MRTFRIVLFGGARQTGKTTLLRDLLDLPATSRFSLDDEAVRRCAIDDPVGFVEALPRPAAIDEFQRAGVGLLLSAKQVADRDRSRGRLLLTGSASYLADRSVSETLAGRAGRLTLWPFSEGERRGVQETFLERLFDASAWPVVFPETPSRAELVDRLLRGAYPEIVTEALPCPVRDARGDRGAQAGKLERGVR